ncbi:MAG: ribosome-binding protein aMBF1 (putative translation factor) [Planctomycetota bacterium]|jgi:ribosome-binding protein aMBF1 (putative translation factor)
MKASKKKKLEKAGWKVSSTDEFLGLSPEESAYIEMKLALCNSVKQTRQKKRLSQVAFAKKIASSQSRVAKMESGDPSVSIDLVLKSLFALGVSKKDVALTITGK